ncbi:GroES-like protein [Penicillium odoratum]|uniref:GroES-like protein n=1 Tax=Penicillium odoratum TaxID=1167516 RepID=UPI002549B94A|nr:GroES-like protein [Penicillium odoratum]KAJ5771546.1 GroES-like protein [Penicillium odoratum]
MGHRFGGIIEEVGDGVTHLSRGQRAVVLPATTGREGMSKKIVAPFSHFYSTPRTISLEAAALIESLAVAWHAVSLSPFKSGDIVLLVGGRPIGLNVVQVLKLQGAEHTILSELMDNRQSLWRKSSATYILDPREDEVAQDVREITGGVGVDIFSTLRAWKRH